MTKNNKVRFLPVSEALTEYAGAKNKAALLNLLVPVSNAAKQSELIQDLLESGEIYHPYPLTDGEAYAFLKEIPLYEESGLLVRMPDWWRKRSRVQAQVNIGGKSQGRFTAKTLLDFNLNASVGGEDLSIEELEQLLVMGSGLRFVKGQWVEVDTDKLKEVLAHWKQVKAQAGDGISMVEGMRMLAGVPMNMKGSDEDESINEWSFISLSNDFKKFIENLRSPDNNKDVSPGKLLKATLRPYQEKGLAWLHFLSEIGLGACLADDMGLGKTIQIIALLLMQAKNKSSSQPSLLVVPASLLSNWKSEIERFAPSLKCTYLHRSLMDAKIFDFMPDTHHTEFKGTDAVLTTYSMFSRQPYLLDFQWNLAVIDEAQAIKNPGSKQTKAIKKINARAKIALTGTPVENRLGDLWSLFDFINPGLLGGAKLFKNFVKTLENRTHDQYKPLRALTAPYLLRRLKTDKSIISDLPDKTEVNAYCTLTKKQAALYEQSVNELAAALENNTEGLQRKGLVLSYLMRFKQICNHPSQLLGDGIYGSGDSGKFARLKEICEEIASRQDKVLIFSQYREITEPLNDFLSDIFGREGLVLHGSTPIKKRKQMVDEFQDEHGPPYFVISLKAGGTGLNLTAASHVIHFDRWWNPAVENQATDRAFRIGQKKNVLVHKFVCPGTLEEKIDQLIQDKTKLATDVLDGSGAETSFTEMSNEQIMNMVTLDINRAIT